MATIIVLNWNNKNIISNCLDSLLVQTCPNREIIVVDNGSRDGSLEIIKEKYGNQLKIIENKKNLGFAEGVNVGIRHSSGEYVALLNSDAVAEPAWLEEMMRVISKSESIGMCACKIYFTGRNKILDNTGSLLSRDSLARCRGRLEKDTGQYDQVKEALTPSGCAALYRRKILEETGMFDRLMFACGEDVDVGMKIRFLGYQCAFVPSAVVYHCLSASTGQVSSLKAYYVERNRLWLAIKFFPVRELLLVRPFTLLRYGFHVFGLFSKKGPAARYAEKASIWMLFLVVLKAHLSTLLFLPHLIMERVRIKQMAQITTQQFRMCMKTFSISIRDAALKELS